MKTHFTLWVMCFVVAALSMLCTEKVWAGTIVGTVLSLGTVQPQAGDNLKTVRFGLVLRSTCDADPALIDRIITIAHFSLDADPHPLATAHLAANFRNAYSTLLAALLAGNRVEMSGSDDDINCNIRSFTFDRIRITIVAEPTLQ